METAVPRDLRREYVGAMRILTPKQRQWIRALPAHGWRRWSAGAALKLSSNTLYKWVRRADVQRALELQRELVELDDDISRGRIASEYAAMAFANPKQFVGEGGKLKPIEDLDAHEAAAVIEFEVIDGKAYPSKLHAKKPALDALVELQRFAPRRLEVTGKDGEPLMPKTEPQEVEIGRRLAFLLAKADAALQTPA